MSKSFTLAKYNLAKATAVLWEAVLDLVFAEVRSTSPLFFR